MGEMREFHLNLKCTAHNEFMMHICPRVPRLLVIKLKSKNIMLINSRTSLEAEFH